MAFQSFILYGKGRSGMYLTRSMSFCETVSCAVAHRAKRREAIEKTDFCIMFILLIFVLGFIFIKCLGKRIQYLSNGKISRTDHFIGSAIVNLQSVTADMVPVGEYAVSKEIGRASCRERVCQYV